MEANMGANYGEFEWLWLYGRAMVDIQIPTPDNGPY